jgi:hypothetical protein
MVSLYEYLGRAAGSSLGWKIAGLAYREGVRKEVRIEPISPYRNGEINTYPPSFLIAVLSADGQILSPFRERYTDEELRIANKASRDQDKALK